MELCIDEGCPHYGTPHVCFFRTKRTIEEIKDEIETLQDCGDLDPCLRDHASERLMELWDELERVSNI